MSLPAGLVVAHVLNFIADKRQGAFAGLVLIDCREISSSSNFIFVLFVSTYPIIFFKRASNVIRELIVNQFRTFDRLTRDSRIEHGQKTRDTYDC